MQELFHLSFEFGSLNFIEFENSEFFEDWMALVTKSCSKVQELDKEQQLEKSWASIHIKVNQDGL